MPEVRFEVAGVPRTNHRARSFVDEDGQLRHRKAKPFAQWKRSVALQARVARPRGWPLGARYAVEVVGFMPAERYDADNLRGVLDACEGVLWANDRQVRPVVYHYGVDKDRPRVLVHVVAYDPAETIAEIDVVLRSRTAQEDA